MVTETGIYLILIKTGSCCKMLLMTQKQRWVQATLVEHCGYDQFDNRRIREPAGGPAYFHQYDDAHQLTGIRTGSDTGDEVAAFQYDDNGNLKQKSENSVVTRTFTYDALERLQQVDGSDISTETYA